MKKDIDKRSDIEILIKAFYEKVKADALLGPVFNDIAKVNWDKHLPVMFDFWENSLLYTGCYTGNPMKSHQHLHEIFPLTEELFQQWLFLFNSAVDELFEGEKALLAKQRAMSISTVIQMKIIQEHVPHKKLD